MEEFFGFAHTLADLARRITTAVSNRAPANKAADGGFDPVTEADLEAEQAMRRMILDRFPDHSILGEEFGLSESTASPYCWSLDPIDGTRSFICGLPQWVTLIALLEHGRPILGLVDAPLLDERYVASFGSAALSSNGRTTDLRTSGCARLADARLSTTDPFLFDEVAAPAFDRVRRQARVSRFGLDGYAYAKLAAGDLDLVIEAGLKPHDLHALIPLVEGAGGAVSDWSGGAGFQSGDIVAAASAELHSQALDLLAAPAA